MALIAMATYCTEQNGRTKYLDQALFSIRETVDLEKHRFIIVDNGSCAEAKTIINAYRYYLPKMEVITNDSNKGTASAVNAAWRMRAKDQHCIKIDDDIVVHCKDWVEQLEEVVAIDPTIGQAGLKRKDCWENVSHENPFYKTTLYQLPHKVGDRWITVEVSNHVMGSAVLHSSALLDKVGYLQQFSNYGLDDSLMSIRSHLAGFKNVFLPHIVIDHIENAPIKEWQQEKEDMVNSAAQQYFETRDKMIRGEMSYYYDGGFK